MPFKGDVLTSGKKIEKIAPGGIGKIDKENIFEIDASGKILTPGFVDIHRHCDAKPFNNPNFGDVEISQGITTVVIGNCGISLVPVPQEPQMVYDFNEAVIGAVSTDMPTTYQEYIEKLKNTKLPINFGTMIGTGAVQITVKGFSDIPFTDEEIEKSKGIIENALENGALGVSLGIMYVPECYNKTEDYGKILEPVGRHGKILTAHIRGEGDSLVQSVKEVIEIAKLANCPLQISHFKSCGMKNWGVEIHKAIAEIEKARENGQNITCDFYPYEGGSTSLTTMLPPVFIAGDMANALKRLGTPQGVEEFRKESKREHKGWDNYCISLGWDRIIISGVKLQEFEPMLGLSVTQAAEKFGFKDPEELAAHLMYKENGKTAIIVMSMLQDDIDIIAKLPYACVISDAIYADTNTPHPRMFGSFPKIIREYVKERKVYTLEEAIHKMTSKPAKVMNIKNRGEIQEGNFADLLIFDPEVFTDHATFTNPARKPTGLDYVILNGEIVLEKDQFKKEKLCGNLILSCNQIK